MTTVRPPAVAGMFYPADTRQLKSDIERYLSHALPSEGPVPKAIIVPHAGYVYSASVAAAAYARLAPLRGQVKRVVVLGPGHRVAVSGLAASGATAFATPLGNIELGGIDGIIDLPQVTISDAAHADEHSLEVHLPFLQVVLGEFTLLPLVVGAAAPEAVAEVLERLWGGPETLIVISSDLSHYLEYQAAQAVDKKTCRAIEELDPASIGREDACGRHPIAGLLVVAKRLGLNVATLDLRNSGDTAGSHDRVVGYGSWLFC